MLTLAMVISYVHRQSLSVVAPVVRDELGITNTGYSEILSGFLIAYTLMQAVTGWMVDRLGTRRGYAVVMLWWSLASALHSIANSVTSFTVLRFLLGAGQAGSWGASVKAVREWFPRSQRGFANGIWGAGTSLGLVATVPLVASLTLWIGWRGSFVLTALLGILWLIPWWLLYRPPADHPLITHQELKFIESEPEESLSKPVPFLTVLRWRGVWAVILARFFADPNAWFYHFWLPEYLNREGGLSLGQIGEVGWIPALTQTVGIVLGGYLSDRLFRGGRGLKQARLRIMLLGMCLMTAGLIAVFPLPLSIIFSGISLATFGFGLWAPNMMSICGEAFPRSAVGSVTGLSGFGAGLGGTTYTLLIGFLVDNAGYSPVFLLVGATPLLAFAILYLLLPQQEMEGV